MLAYLFYETDSAMGIGRNKNGLSKRGTVAHRGQIITEFILLKSPPDSRTCQRLTSAILKEETLT